MPSCTSSTAASSSTNPPGPAARTVDPNVDLDVDVDVEEKNPPTRKKPDEKIADIAIGLSLLSWGVRGFFFVDAAERFAPPRLTLSVLQLVVGLMFLFRRSLVFRASWRDLAVALPSFFLGSAAMALARPWSQWPLPAEMLFAVGGAGAMLSLATLGRCFAILPGARGVVVRGPYRIVRHPAYAGELIMLGGCAWALGLPLGPIALVAALPCIAVRILAEERSLNRLEAYRAYAEKVRWRLVPLLW